jgi:hypothetical protein
MPPKSVLAFIVPRLGIQLENAVTDCLCYILGEHTDAANSFLRHLSSTGVALPEGLKFHTQVVWSLGEGRPDMVGEVGQRIHLIVEAKFDAPLTPSQPVGYLKALPSAAGGVLLFICPAARKDEIWASLAKRCGNKRIALGARADSPNGLVSASLGESLSLALTTWEGLIHTLRADLAKAGNPPALEDVTQLATLCERLLSGELKSSPSLDGVRFEEGWQKQLRLTVDRISRALTEAGHAKTRGYRATPGPGYYKRYMTLSGRVNWCVEFNTEYWALLGESLLWLSTTITPETQADCDLLNQRLGNAAHKLRDQLLIPLLMAHSQTEGQAVDHMSRQAAAVAKHLAVIAR